MDTIAVIIPLTRGKISLVSPCDAERVQAHRWCASPAKSGLWYAIHSVVRNGKRTTESMHRFILNATGEVDHADGNGLNNQRENICEASRNRNKHRRHVIRSKSGFYGVSQRKWGFAAYISVNNRTRYLGQFAEAEEAARRYDAAALEIHGEGAMLNFPHQRDKDGHWTRIQ